MMPDLSFHISVPEPLVSSRRMLAAHRKAAKAAMKFVLLDHWKRRIPEHFKPSASAKYRYQKRSPKYNAKKERRGGTAVDMVKRGVSRRLMTGIPPTIRMGGSIGTNKSGDVGEIVGVARMKWPFPTSADNPKPQYVTIRKMSEEMGRFTNVEVQQIANKYRDEYIRKLREIFAKSPKMLKNVNSQFS